MDAASDRDTGPPLDRTGYVLEVDDRFEDLDGSRWLPHHLPHWSSREAAAARFTTGPDGLQLHIDRDQPAWCPEFDGTTRVSSLQTGLFAGPLGSPVGQHRFGGRPLVREEQPTLRLYTPTYGLFELRARASADPACMVALWMIGLEDVPEHSGEICVAEIFGRGVGPASATVGLGVHPFGDPTLVDDFRTVALPIDARQPHTYAMGWTPGRVAFWVDERPVAAIDQAPDYPMQLMLGIYEFRGQDGDPAGAYPKTFAVERFRGWRRRT